MIEYRATLLGRQRTCVKSRWRGGTRRTTNGALVHSFVRYPPDWVLQKPAFLSAAGVVDQLHSYREHTSLVVMSSQLEDLLFSLENLQLGVWTVLGNQKNERVPFHWRHKQFVPLSNGNRPMFSHQRLFIRHILRSEESVLAKALGFSVRKFTVSEEQVLIRCNRPFYRQFGTLNEEQNETPADVSNNDTTTGRKLVPPGVCGICRLFFYDEKTERVVQVCVVVNKFRNNVDLFVRATSPEQIAFFNKEKPFKDGKKLLRESTVLSDSFEMEFELDLPVKRRISGTFIVARVTIETTFSDRKSAFVYKHEDDGNSAPTCVCVDSDEATWAGDTVCRYRSCWCIPARLSGEYARTVTSEDRVKCKTDSFLYLHRLFYLQKRCVPRGYYNVYFDLGHGIGITAAAICLCLWSGSRNNWFVVDSCLVDRFVDTANEFNSCVLFVVRSVKDYNEFYTHYDYYSRSCNVVIFDSFYFHVFFNKCFSRDYVYAVSPFRIFFYDHHRPDTAYGVEKMIGRFNYILRINNRASWELMDLGHSLSVATIDTSCIEEMFRLPNVDHTIHLSNSYVDDQEVYDPNGRYANAEENRLLLFDLFTRSYLKEDLRSEKIDIVHWNPNAEKSFHLTQRVCHGDCVICHSRNNDYYVTKCCCQPICIHCFPRLRRNSSHVSCPICRGTFEKRSLVPFLLTNQEYLEANPINRPTRFNWFCDPLKFVLCDLFSLSNDIGIYYFHDTSLALKVIVVDSNYLYEDNHYRLVQGFYPCFINSYNEYTLKTFRCCPTHAVLVVRDLYALSGLHFPFVTHLYFVDKPSLSEYTIVLRMLHRYPRKEKLIIHEFLPELEQSFVRNLADIFTPPLLFA